MICWATSGGRPRHCRRRAVVVPGTRGAVAGIVAKIIRADYEDDRPVLRKHREELGPYLTDTELPQVPEAKTKRPPANPDPR